MVGSIDETKQILSIGGWVLFGLLSILACKYGINVLQLRTLSAELRRRRPSLPIPEVSFVFDLVGTLLTAGVLAPIVGVCIFFMVSCNSLVNSNAPSPNWSTFWSLVVLMLWPFSSYLLLWRLNRHATNLRKAVEGAVALADRSRAPRNCVLYLRSVTGDRRTIHAQTGPNGETGEVNVQPAAENLRSMLGKHVPVYALWDPKKDQRPNLHFLPVLSSDECWQDDVIALADHAIFIVADFEANRHGGLSEGVTWETDFLLKHQYLLSKTLAVVSDDDPPSSVIDELAKVARWTVRIPKRGANISHLWKIPTELVDLIANVEK